MNLIRDYIKKCDEVYHTTLNPNGFGCVRIHLVPPAKPKEWIPWVVILNGYSVLPLQSSWAILLKEYMSVLNQYHGKQLSDKDFDKVNDATIDRMKKIFKHTPIQAFKDDLADMIKTFRDVAMGRTPEAKLGYMTLAQYAKYMKAPHRMDIMVSAMEKGGKWNCNQRCVHCYAASGEMANTREMTTDEWKKAIDKLRQACIPALTFTGGEATLRDDLVELIDYSKWFVTRLNTNGILLNRQLCDKLYSASLDSVQITLYSSNPKIHNELVGGNHFTSTVAGIKNAVAAGLDVSINTPLCSLNSDYISTVKFAADLGVKYFSCSGLIPAGNALTKESNQTRLTKSEITNSVIEAVEYAEQKGYEIAFTSPGWIDSRVLKRYNVVVPSCGACLSNMAIAPDGTVIPCQSWLGGEGLGNIIDDSWEKIWKNSDTKFIRKKATKEAEVCLLQEGK